MGRSSIIDDKIPCDEILESLYKLRIRESDQTQNRIGIVRHGGSSEDIGFRSSEVENYGEKDYETLTPDMGKLNL